MADFPNERLNFSFKNVPVYSFDSPNCLANVDAYTDLVPAIFLGLCHLKHQCSKKSKRSDQMKILAFSKDGGFMPNY